MEKVMRVLKEWGPVMLFCVVSALVFGVIVAVLQHVAGPGC